MSDPFAAKVRAFVESELIPCERELLSLAFRDALPRLTALREKVKALGMWAPQLPKELGGCGLPLVLFAKVSEELGRTPYGHFVFNCHAPDVGNMEVLLKFGNDEQKARYLEPLAKGAIRSCFSMTEPDVPGSNPTWLETTATRDGDDYVINGKKWFTSSADGAEFAIVMAVTDPGAAKPHERASMLVVPTNTKGFRLVRNVPVMGHEGDGWVSHAEIHYEECRVPAKNLLGSLGAGFTIAQERLGPGRVHHAMRWIGIAERALELMCKRAIVRQLSPGSPLAAHETLQMWVAESRAEIHASRLMVLDAAEKMEKHGGHAARDEISLVKFYVAGALGRVLDRAVQAHGALGLTDETPLALWYRSERAARIYDGPDEVHKISVGKRILRAMAKS